MNRLLILLLFLIHWNLFAEEGKDLHIKYADEIIRSFAEDMLREFGLECIGDGGQMSRDIVAMKVKFNAYQRATIDQACALEVKATEKFLDAINNHPKIRPYLREYPFTAPRAEIAISFNKLNGQPYTDGIVVGHVFQGRGFMYYCKRAENGHLSDLGEEPYQAALKIVKNPHLNLKHDFSKRWSKKIERSLVLCPEQEEKFLKNYSTQTPFQRWEHLKEIAENDARLTLSEAIRELITGVTDPYFVEDTLVKIVAMERTQHSGEYVEYWDNGQIKVKAAFKNGLADGHIHGWYENGYDAFKGHFSEGIKQGIHIAFFPPQRNGGPLVGEGRFLTYNEYGKAHGSQQTDHLNGRLESFMTYDNGVIDGKMGVYADNYGGLLEERKYDKGQLVDQKIYPPKRTPKKSKVKK